MVDLKKYKKCLWIIVSLLLVAGCAHEDIRINDVQNTSTGEAKIYIPTDAIAKAYTWEEICEYFGQDVSIASLPAFFDNTVKNQKYEIYVDANDTVVYDNVELFYEGEEGQYISLIVSKGKMPVTDVVYTGGESSVIAGEEVCIYKAGDVYKATFLHNNIGYDLSVSNLSEKEIVMLVKEILEK